MNTSLRKIGVAVTAASTTLFPLGFPLIPSPARAALLEFNFTTRQGGTGSFILDTSIQDTRPDLDIFDVYPGAISNFTFSGTRPAASQGELVVQFSQFRINSAAYGGPFRPSQGDGPVSQIIFNFSSFIGRNFLASSPDQYASIPTQAGFVLFSTGGSPREDINSITVRSITIPEPSSLFGLMSLAALYAGLALHHSSKQKS